MERILAIFGFDTWLESTDVENGLGWPAAVEDLLVVCAMVRCRQR